MEKLTAELKETSVHTSKDIRTLNYCLAVCLIGSIGSWWLFFYGPAPQWVNGLALSIDHFFLGTVVLARTAIRYVERAVTLLIDRMTDIAQRDSRPKT